MTQKALISILVREPSCWTSGWKQNQPWHKKWPQVLEEGQKSFKMQTVVSDSDSAKSQQKVQNGQSLKRQVEIILKCKQCHFRLTQDTLVHTWAENKKNHSWKSPGSGSRQANQSWLSREMKTPHILMLTFWNHHWSTKWHVLTLSLIAVNWRNNFFLQILPSTLSLSFIWN